MVVGVVGVVGGGSGSVDGASVGGVPGGGVLLLLLLLVVMVLVGGVGGGGEWCQWFCGWLFWWWVGVVQVRLSPDNSHHEQTSFAAVRFRLLWVGVWSCWFSCRKFLGDDAKLGRVCVMSTVLTTLGQVCKTSPRVVCSSDSLVWCFAAFVVATMQKHPQETSAHSPW